MAPDTVPSPEPMRFRSTVPVTAPLEIAPVTSSVPATDSMVYSVPPAARSMLPAQVFVPD